MAQLVRSGGMIMALESGGVFETIDELIDCFCTAAKHVGVSLTVLDSGGRSDRVDPPRGTAQGGGQGIQEGPLWVLFVCSKAPV